jgi:hypothetical protein
MIRQRHPRKILDAPLIEALDGAYAQMGSWKAVARHTGTSVVTLNHVRAGRTPAPPQVLQALGLRLDIHIVYDYRRAEG